MKILIMVQFQVPRGLSDYPYKNQPLLIQLVRSLFTCCNVSLPGMNCIKLQESTPYFDASTHPLASLHPCAPMFCLLPFWRKSRGPGTYIQHSIVKSESCISSHYTWPLRKLSNTSVSRCAPPGWAVVTVEAPCQWWNGPKDDLPGSGKRGVPLRTSKKRSDRTGCLEDFVNKKNYFPHHFPFWCLASFFIRISCLAGCVLSCIAYFSKAVGNISSQKCPKVTYHYHICDPLTSVIQRIDHGSKQPFTKNISIKIHKYVKMPGISSTTYQAGIHPHVLQRKYWWCLYQHLVGSPLDTAGFRLLAPQRHIQNSS